ncbi:MAG: DUF493 domain-containing protein [Pseudomonadota bacterium]
MKTETLIEYPCRFPIKVMGKSEQGFAEAIAAVVRRHAPDFDAATMEIRASRGGKYLSLTCTFTVTSREQIDALYQELCDHPLVKVVL